MNARWMILAVTLICTSSLYAVQSDLADLAGTWTCRLDPQNIGEKQKWFSQELEIPCRLPGTLDENQLGTPNTKPPVFDTEILRCLGRRFEYTGPAWYQTTVMIPQDWTNKDVSLSLERVLWESVVWIDDIRIGSQDSLIAPHVFSLPALITPGRHKLTVRVDNSSKYNVGTHQNMPYPMAHAYTNQTQTIWNGIIGQITLQARDRVFISHIRTVPNLQKKNVQIKMEIANTTGKAVSGTWTISCSQTGRPVEIAFSGQAPVIQVQAEYDMGRDVRLWDEFQPALYDLAIECKASADGVQFKDSKGVRFGMRQLSADGAVLKINDRPIFLRGILECCVFPRTGHPPMDIKAWQRIYTIARSYGLNHLRFHSWCPPQAAFTAADEAGFYLQVELPSWIPDAGRDAPRDQFMRLEAARILRQYGNHPSFCFLSMGNELSGDFAFLHDLVNGLKKQDPRHFYTSTTFSFDGTFGQWPGSVDDYFISQYTPKGWIRGQGFFNDQKPSTSFDFRASIKDMPVPVISHEIGQYAVFPNFNEIPKYTGVTQPLNLLAIQKNLEEKGLLSLAGDYLKASGSWAVQLYKQDIELALRTPGMSGFQLLGLHDFPGQGTALVGILDAFWDPKGLIEPQEFRQFCNCTVPLARMEKCTFENTQEFVASIEVLHYGRQDMPGAVVHWQIQAAGATPVMEGDFKPITLKTADRTVFGQIRADLKSVAKAQKMTLTVSIQGTEYQNHWDFWVYPASPNMPDCKDVVIARFPDQHVAQALEQGRKVLLLAESDGLKDKVVGRFVPVFWSPVLFPDQPVTMGLLCDPAHPALRDFPTDPWTSWQWWELLTRSAAPVMDQAPRNFMPIVRMIDGFTKNRRLYNLFEARVGKGKLLFCSMDVTTDLDQRIVARQLRKSLLTYASSEQFNPRQTLSFQFVRSLFNESPSMQGASVIERDSHQAGSETNSIEGNSEHP